MWTSVHIYPHLSKARLLLETKGGINEQCLQWVPCIPGTTAQDVPLLGDGTYRKAIQEGLMYALIRIQEEGASTPLGRLEAHRSDRKF